jgi:hypothetical protein
MTESKSKSIRLKNGTSFPHTEPVFQCHSFLAEIGLVPEKTNHSKAD